MKFLKTFDDLTLCFNGCLHVTLNLFFIDICELKQELNLLEEGQEEYDTIMGRMVALMTRKFHK